MAINISALDTATGYPSIGTYHTLGVRGMLGDDTTVVFDSGEDVFITEKVDGANGRIILLPGGDYFIGNRKQLLHARADRLPNQNADNLAIVAALEPAAEILAEAWCGEQIHVVYAEVYGAGLTRSWAEYTASKSTTGVRMFDAAVIDPEVLDWPLDAIAGWRDRGEQTFKPVTFELPAEAGIEKVPHLAVVDGGAVPTGRDETEAWMAELLPRSLAGIDGTGHGDAEGIVARTANRSKIVKCRKDTYAKTKRQLANFQK